jgi:hypothetical protein
MFKQYKIKIGRSTKDNLSKQLDNLMKPMKCDIGNVNSDIVDIINEGLEQ